MDSKESKEKMTYKIEDFKGMVGSFFEAEQIPSRTTIGSRISDPKNAEFQNHVLRTTLGLVRRPITKEPSIFDPCFIVGLQP